MEENAMPTVRNLEDVNLEGSGEHRATTGLRAVWLIEDLAALGGRSESNEHLDTGDACDLCERARVLLREMKGRTL
jgi:hypothetical protein